MGEYIQLADGEVVKVGTCEDCYYTTLDQLREAVAAGAQKVPGNLEPARYLDPAESFRYRFPFPDERHMTIGTHQPHDRGVAVEVPEELLHSEHDTVSLRMQTIGARVYEDYYLRMQSIGPGAHVDHYGLSVRVGCPLDPDPGKRPETFHPVTPVVQVVQQKQVEGAVWVVLRCAYCGALWRVAPDQGAALVAHLRERYQGDRFVLAIADEIRRGYAVAGEAGE